MIIKRNSITEGIYVLLFQAVIVTLVIAIQVINNILILLGIVIAVVAIYYLILKKEGNADWIKGLLNRQKTLVLVGFLIVALLYPFIHINNCYWIFIGTLVWINVIMTLGLNYQVGSTDMVNLGYAAFYAVGAYTSALLVIRFGISFWLALVTAGIFAAIFGLVLGLPTLKTKSYYLSLVTIAFGFSVRLLLRNMYWTGGPDGIMGIPPPTIFSFSFFSSVELFGIRLPSEINFYYLALVFALVAILCASILRNSHFGLVLNAIRDNEIAARCSGIKTWLYKLLAFIIGAFWGGIAGSIYAHTAGYINPQNFSFAVSITLVCMVILGGMDNVAGVILGTLMLTILPEKFRAFADYRMLMFGAIIVIVLIYSPKGILPAQPRVYGALLQKLINKKVRSAK
ncbi:branched-chain amino acid ABC transporter permease [Candidatus Atribacteria bacterium 1244-E10-H5-B2]|nr:MAG: branched-chain amino acid ABC transporter permease [Candidatus Atribacteria bacterium 1244-E10-H5-B2]